MIVEFLELLLLGAHEEGHLNSHIAFASPSFPALALTSTVAQMAYVSEAPSMPLPTGSEGSSILHW